MNLRDQRAIRTLRHGSRGDDWELRERRHLGERHRVRPQGWHVHVLHGLE